MRVKYPHSRLAAVSATAMLTALGLAAPFAAQAQSAYPGTVLADGPQAYFRLGAVNQGSSVNGYTTTFNGDAAATAIGGGAPLTGEPGNVGAALDGTSGTSVFTSLSSTGSSDPSATYAGTITAWVDLSQLPSAAGRYFYIAGRSQVGNDFDVQIQSDNSLYFYTDGGSSISYALPTAGAGSVLNQYIFVAATVDPTAQTRSLYVNGVQVATQSGYTGDNSYKTSVFTIGDSSVFTGRNLAGSVDEVALFNRALSASQIQSLYNSSFAVAPELSQTAALGLGVFGLAALALKARGRKPVA
jgi:hypothetical protein